MPVHGKLVDVQRVSLILDEDVSSPCDGEVGHIVLLPVHKCLHFDGRDDIF